RSAADGVWRPGVPLRRLIRQHHPRVADANLGVADFAIGHWHAHQLGRVEDLLVEFDRRRSALHDQVRRGGVESLWNESVRFLRHLRIASEKTAEATNHKTAARSSRSAPAARAGVDLATRRGARL